MFGKYNSLIYNNLGVLTKHGYNYLVLLLEGIRTLGVFSSFVWLLEGILTVPVFKFSLVAGRNTYSSCF